MTYSQKMDVRNGFEDVDGIFVKSGCPVEFCAVGQKHWRYCRTPAL
jgi:hypothetical protein